MEFANDKQNETEHETPQIITVYCPTEENLPGVDGRKDDSRISSGSDFEEAVDATGYGLFNILLLLAVFPGGWASYFDMTATSYVVPSAECDLQMGLYHKGVLNAITFAGMMSSAFLWGFLADTRGRRSLLQYGYLADVICNIMCSMSQSFYALVIFKFFTGFIINGPSVINMSYLAEFHGTKYRSRTLLWANLFPAFANLALPGLAWAIIPQPWSFTLFNGAFVYNSWRIFILFCSLPALFAYLTLFYFPESPRFLMSQGRNEEALKVFQKMYAMNTGNPPETFPVKLLCQEDQKKHEERSNSRKSMSLWDKTRQDWDQIKPLFQNPYLYQFLLITTIQVGSLISVNMLRLWMPQLFTMMENFDYENRDPSLGSPTLCDMISPSTLPNATINDQLNSTTMDTCVVTPLQTRVYINSIILAVSSLIGYTIAANLVHLIGKKILLLLAYTITATCSFVVNWSTNSDLTLAFIAVYMTLTGISVNTILTVIVDLMPTALRAMAVSMNMCIGRSGAVAGNILFPILLNMGCTVPFMFTGGILLVCFMLTLFIPKPPSKLM